MLVTTRRIGESLIIGGNAEIVVKVLGVNGHQVRIGVEADKDIPVNREEVFDRIQQEKLANG